MRALFVVVVWLLAACSRSVPEPAAAPANRVAAPAEATARAPDGPAVDASPAPAGLSPQAEVDEALRELQELEVRMCACSNKACADRAIADMIAMGKRYENTNASDDDMRRAAAIVERLEPCMATALATP